MSTVVFDGSELGVGTLCGPAERDGEKIEDRTLWQFAIKDYSDVAYLTRDEIMVLISCLFVSLGYRHFTWNAAK